MWLPLQVILRYPVAQTEQFHKFLKTGKTNGR